MVHEIARSVLGSSRTLWTSVDLPEPEGPETMKTSGSGLVGHRYSRFWTCSRSFSISDLTSRARLRDFQAFGFCAGSFGEKRVGFALHFLQEEIELFADFAACG